MNRNELIVLYYEEVLRQNKHHFLNKFEVTYDDMVFGIKNVEIPLTIKYIYERIKNSVYVDEFDLFMFAIKNDKLKNLTALIEIGFNINCYLNGPLNISIITNKYKIFKYIVNKTGNLFTCENLTIKFILKYKRFEMLSFLLKKLYISINFDNGFMMKYCIETSNYSMAIFLITNNFDINIGDNYLFNYAKKKCYEIFLLIETENYLNK